MKRLKNISLIKEQKYPPPGEKKTKETDKQFAW